MNNSNSFELDEKPISIRQQKKKGSFAGDVLRVASGVSIAQAIALLASPILTRLFAPEAFGLAALFASIVAIFDVISGLRYELSIMLPEKDEEAANLLGISLFFNIITSLMLAILFWVVRDSLLQLLNAPQLSPYVWLLPITIFITGLYGTFNHWNSRTRQFTRLSIARINDSIVTTLSQLGLGAIGFISGGSLLVGRLVGTSASVLLLSVQIWREDRMLFRSSINWKGMFSGVKRYRNFPFFTTWSGLLNTLSWQLPTFLLQIYFTSVEVGFYALGYRVLRLPINLIGSSIGRVFFQRAAEARVEGKLSQVVENAISRMVMLGFFPMLLMTIIGRDLFIVAFGFEWAEAGVYMQILSIYSFLWFLAASIGNLISVLEKQKLGLVWNIVNFCTRLLSLVIGGSLNNPRLALLLFAISGFFVYGFLFLKISHLSGVSPKIISNIFFSKILLFMPFAVLLIILKLAGVHTWLFLFVAGTELGIFFIYLILKEKKTRMLVKQLWKNISY